ncbi:MAG: AbrB/MazE/SpoVT family DNA-binding domain-containing protein [Deltaproteobacteria bacterium]|jgi:AbrB family looped-hinge helix DNA binding protein|nr:AbrB/MazE/SpoVT family DNA-binding domain-containing protein [Deltaproteobacteria bacterium]NTV58939.1 AbrB/MazE/SpoVT family DNA-binding domain-containing protein [Deltaproteobacteria bacterium]
MSVVRTSSKGQIVIPVEIRRKLGIKPGQRVTLTLIEDKAVITPLPMDPIKALRGTLKGEPSMTKDLLRERKEEIKREKEIASRLLRHSRLDSR